MPRTITEDDLDELELQRRPKGVPQDEWLRARVDTLLEWADSAEFELDGVWRSELLMVAAEHLSTIGDHEAAVEVARRACSQNDPDAVAAIAVLIEVLLERGSADDAEVEAARLRAELRGDPYAVDASTLERVGEEFAYHGHLALAERWFTLGVRNAELTDAPDVILARAMTFRAAVRRRQGKPEDAMDLDARALADALGWSQDEDPLLYGDEDAPPATSRRPS